MITAMSLRQPLLERRNPMIDGMPPSISKSTLILRGAIGFFAGLLLGIFSLLFLGVLHGHHDLNQPDLELERRYEWLVVGIACTVAMLAMSAGQYRLSRFWMWFFVAFGMICAIPWWPFKDGSLLPLGTPYVNGGFAWSKAALLGIHTSIAVLIAAVIHRLRPETNDTVEAETSIEIAPHTTDTKSATTGGSEFVSPNSNRPDESIL